MVGLWSPSGSLIAAFRAVDGSSAWQRALGASVTVPAVIEGERVFAALSDGRLVGLDLATGEMIWTAWLMSAPAGLLSGNGLVYFGAANGKLSAYTQDRGAFKWAHVTRADPSRSTIAVTDGTRVYLASRDHSVWALDARTGNLRWHSRVTARPAVSPWLDDKSLVVALVTGEVDVIEARTGKTSSTLPAPAPVAIAGVPVDLPDARVFSTRGLRVARGRAGTRNVRLICLSVADLHAGARSCRSRARSRRRSSAACPIVAPASINRRRQSRDTLLRSDLATAPKTTA